MSTQYWLCVTILSGTISFGAGVLLSYKATIHYVKKSLLQAIEEGELSCLRRPGSSSASS
jgi:hypothetical protein